MFGKPAPFAFRLFVFGVEVTADVGSYTVPRGVGRAAGRATFTLANPWGRYSISPSDASLLYTGQVDGVNDAYAEAARNAVDLNIADPLKARVIAAKVGNVKTVHIAAPNGNAPVPSRVLRWRFMSGGCIFHPGDPVRLFEMDEHGFWHYGFTGKVLSPELATEPSGLTTLTLTCIDALGDLEQARVSFNPLITDAAVVATTRDGLASSWYGDGLSDLPVGEYVEALAFGTSDPSDATAERAFAGLPTPVHERFSANGPGTTERLATFGAGCYDRANSIITYYPSGVNLDDWQRTIDSRVSVDDLYRMASWPDAPTEAEANADTATVLMGQDPNVSDGALIRASQPSRVDETTLVTLIGEHPELYPVDRGRILQLYPESFEGYDTNIIVKDITGGPGFEAEWKTRLGMLTDMLARIGHVLYATAAGDVVVEPKLWSYDADRWGDFAARYTFGANDIVGRLSTGLDTTRLVSVVTAKPVVAAGYETFQTPDGIPPEVAIAYGLVGAFGCRIERAPPRAHIATPEGARAYAALTLAEANGEVDSATYPIFPRLGLGPNRPALLTHRLEVGAIQTINWTVSIGRDRLTATMALGVNHIRRFAGQTRNDGALVYEPLDGVLSDTAIWARILSDVSAPLNDVSVARSGEVTDAVAVSQTPAQGIVAPALATDALFHSIVYGESRGRNIRGPELPTSSSAAGQQAIGIGQVLPSNVRQWSIDAQVPGAPLTPAAFEASPALQEQIVRFKLAQFYAEGVQRTGSSEGGVTFAAAAWHAGEPAARSGAWRTRRDQATGLATQTYVDNAVARWRRRVGAASGYAPGE